MTSMDKETYPTREKYLVCDTIQDFQDATNGPVVEKVVGSSLDRSGNMWIVNDNDGVVKGASTLPYKNPNILRNTDKRL